MIFQPIRPFHINQKFGENLACVSTDGKNRVVTKTGATCPAGFKSLYGAKGHGGLDLRAYHGQEVYASHDGTVYQIDTDPKSGLDVRLEGDGIRTIYEHLMGYQVKVGQAVKTGDLIGWADNTGYSSGDHLHFEYHELVKGGWVRKDPLSVMEPTFALVIKLQKDLIGYLKELLAKLLDNSASKLR